MELKGLDRFQKKLPVLSGKRIILIPAFALIVAALFGTAIFFIYSFASDLDPLGPLLPLLAIILIEATALLLVYQMWFWRDRLKVKYGEGSYQRILFVGFAGICIMIALAFNSLTPIQEINAGLWKDPSFSIWVEPFTSLSGMDIQYLGIARYMISGFLLLLGIITIARSLLTFGIDYMALVYLYFPEEGKIQDLEIYSILRHPAYAGIVLISISGFMYNFTLFSLLYMIIHLSGLSIHIMLVEEKELIQRFGSSYREYRDSVPAVFVRPKDWKKYFRFLVGNA